LQQKKKNQRRKKKNRNARPTGNGHTSKCTGGGKKGGEQEENQTRSFYKVRERGDGLPSMRTPCPRKEYGGFCKSSTKGKDKGGGERGPVKSAQIISCAPGPEI